MASIIDIHVHPVSRDLVRDPRNLRLMDLQAECLAPQSAVERLLERMDRAGVDKACLMGPTPNDGIALTNEMVRAMVKAHPDRLIGFVGLNPFADDPQKVGDTISAAADEWGFKGVGEFGGGDLMDPRCERVYRACAERGLPLLVHVGIPLPSMLLKHGQPAALDELANRHPELTIIAAHAGAPWVVETIAIAVRHPNVYIDISSLPAMRGGLAKLVLMLCYEHGLEDRVLFGTDFPLVDPARYVGLLHGLNPNPLVRWPFKLKRVTPEMREKLLGGNAQRLLKLGAH